MRESQRSKFWEGVATALLVIGLVYFSDTSRNILWLMTAAICIASHYQGLLAYRVVFILQIVAIFASTLSVYWNVASMLQSLRRRRKPSSRI